MNGGQKGGQGKKTVPINVILTNGHTEKNMMPYKNTSAGSTEKKEWEYTNNNQPPPAHMLCGRTEMREKHCSGWLRAAPNRTG